MTGEFIPTRSAGSWSPIALVPTMHITECGAQVQLPAAPAARG